MRIPVLLVAMASAATCGAAEFFVSPSGNDAAPGTKAKPFATITRARDEVRTLVNETHDAGSYRVLWDARDNNGNRVTSGVYYYRMKAGSFVRTNKMVLIY